MMHESIREGLESYLSGESNAQMDAHLAECPECREMVAGMKAQSVMFAGLRVPTDFEPDPGFYARVINRIETQSRSSFWSVFLEPVFGRRLVYASVTFLLLFGVFLATSDSPTVVAESYTPELFLTEQQQPVSFNADQDEDREVVLVNLATYHE